MELTVWTLPEGPVDEREVLRYAMMPAGSGDVAEPLRACIAMARGKAAGRAVSARFPVRRDGDLLDLGFARTDSQALRKSLQGCDAVFLFAVTVGLELDRLIARCRHISPVYTLLLQALGAERAESACDALEQRLAAALEPGEILRPRFSPGYGDLPLSLQKDVFRALDCERRLGLTLTDSLLMVPSKSVTAIAGIASGAAV